MCRERISMIENEQQYKFCLQAILDGVSTMHHVQVRMHSTWEYTVASIPVDVPCALEGV